MKVEEQARRGYMMYNRSTITELDEMFVVATIFCEAPKSRFG